MTQPCVENKPAFYNGYTLFITSLYKNYNVPLKSQICVRNPCSFLQKRRETQALMCEVQAVEGQTT